MIDMYWFTKWHLFVPYLAFLELSLPIDVGNTAGLSSMLLSATRIHLRTCRLIDPSILNEPSFRQD